MKALLELLQVLLNALLPHAVVGVGVPGSGKTYTLRQLADAADYAYVCPDELRKLIAGSASNMSKDQEVFDEVYKQLEEALQAGRSVIFDATNAHSRYRPPLVQRLLGYGAQQVIAAYFDCPLELARAQNAARERLVPDDAIKSKHVLLSQRPPRVSEGFAYVVTIRPA